MLGPPRTSTATYSNNGSGYSLIEIRSNSYGASDDFNTRLDRVNESTILF